MPKLDSATITQHHDRRLDEERWQATLSNGLTLIVAPRPGFASNYAVFTSRFGGVDLAWKRNGEARSMPAGIAHFLEHQLFKKARGDLMEEFDARGAAVNAETTFTSTSYYFESTSDTRENIDLLLEMCLTPWFDERSVEIEREIIIQEILSYRDHPGWVNYQDLLACLYQHLPLREDIAGDEHSVSATTPAMLAECHAAFYHPENCALIVSGDLDPFDVLAWAEASCADYLPASSQRSKIVRTPPREGKGVARTSFDRRMAVATPRVLLGVKGPSGAQGEALQRENWRAQLVLDLLFGASSDYYREAYDEGLIGDDFGTEFVNDPRFAYALIGGESEDPDALSELIRSTLDAAARDGVDADAFARKQRALIGSVLREFETPEYTAFAHADGWLRGYDALSLLSMAESIALDEINASAAELAQPRRRAIAVLEGME